MSDFASVIERARLAFASVAKIESALTRDPGNVALQVNLAASRKLARKSEEQIRELSEHKRIDICKYRLVSHLDRAFKIGPVSRSLFEYQNLFSQVYDAIKNGVKGRAQVGAEAALESALELAYTYNGSLGFALIAHSDRDFFDGKLDKPIDVLFEITDASNRDSIREVAANYGNSVVKRLYDWSKANLDGQFSTDVQWTRSDGRRIGKFIDNNTLVDIVNLIAAASDEKRAEHHVRGILIGGDLRSGTFHFVVPNGDDYRGSIAASFDNAAVMTLGREYLALISARTKIVYATEKVEVRYELEALWEPSDPKSTAHPTSHE